MNFTLSAQSELLHATIVQPSSTSDGCNHLKVMNGGNDDIIYNDDGGCCKYCIIKKNNDEIIIEEKE